jgi:predicted dienelactone hydrolase
MHDTARKTAGCEYLCRLPDRAVGESGHRDALDPLQGKDTVTAPARRRSIWIGLALVGLLAGCQGDAGDTVDPIGRDLPPLTSKELLDPGPYASGTLRLRLVDANRPTDPNGGYPGAPNRTLETQVWYPTEPETAGARKTAVPTRAPAGGPFPLIVYSHGFMSFGSEGVYLAEHLATHGYVVACPDFPLTCLWAPGGPKIEDVVNQPGDVSFLIDTFLAFHQDPASPFYGLVDGSRVGVTGLSLGGMTTSLVTYHPYLRDPRISAAATLAGPGSMFNEVFYRNSQSPLLALFGDIDAMVDYETNAPVTREMAGPRATLVKIRGASHTGFSYPAYLFMEQMDNPDLLGCMALTSGISLDADFPALLGGAEAGVVQRETPYPCTVSPLPRSMRPSRQHEVTILCVLSFLESRFGADEPSRIRAARFLRETLATENPEVTLADSSKW